MEWHQLEKNQSMLIFLILGKKKNAISCMQSNLTHPEIQGSMTEKSKDGWAYNSNAFWLLLCISNAVWLIAAPSFLQWYHLIVRQRSEVFNSLTESQCLPNSIAVIPLEKDSARCVFWSNFTEKRHNLHTVYLVMSPKSIPLSVALLFKIHHDMAYHYINECCSTHTWLMFSSGKHFSLEKKLQNLIEKPKCVLILDS